MYIYAYVCVSVCVHAYTSELVLMELTPPEDNDLAIDLGAIYTPPLSEAIGTSVTQSARGVSVLLVCTVLCQDGGGGAVGHC